MGVVLDNAYTHKLLACAYSVHSALGPGLLESVYEAALVYELKSQVKSVAEIQPVHHKQLLTYMRLTGIKLGYIINFNVESLRDGIYRVINGYLTP